MDFPSFKRHFLVCFPAFLNVKPPFCHGSCYWIFRKKQLQWILLWNFPLKKQSISSGSCRGFSLENIPQCWTFRRPGRSCTSAAASSCPSTTRGAVPRRRPVEMAGKIEALGVSLKGLEWFRYWLVVWSIFLFSHILGIILPID